MAKDTGFVGLGDGSAPPLPEIDGPSGRKGRPGPASEEPFHWGLALLGIPAAMATLLPVASLAEMAGLPEPWDWLAAQICAGVAFNAVYHARDREGTRLKNAAVGTAVFLAAVAFTRWIFT